MRIFIYFTDTTDNSDIYIRWTHTHTAENMHLYIRWKHTLPKKAPLYLPESHTADNKHLYIRWKNALPKSSTFIFAGNTHCRK
jgi:hypothetical protein